MATNVLYGATRQSSLLDRLYASVVAFLNRVAEIERRNGSVEPFGL
ncbi:MULTISPECIES: hypothetical protein [unclassified Alsobacter]|jgi:hypothetical protein|uniref:Uncharacterized protein n=1 Tax=Alsobacter sp. KACC 23698 TaxID=3149229 RepID=A0AAU7JHK4_9HYPH